MKNMKIGTKLFAGFGILVILLGMVGFVSRQRMTAILSETDALATRSVPSVALSTAIERSVLRAEKELGLYAATWEDDYLASSMPLLDEIRQSLSQAEALAANEPSLSNLKASTTQALAIMDDYDSQLLEMQLVVSAIEQAMRLANVAAEGYRAKCYELLDAENRLMETEIGAGAPPGTLLKRQHMISLLHDIIDLNSQMQVATAQALQFQDNDYIDKALALFEKAGESIEELKKTTDNPEFLETLEVISNNATTYAATLDTFAEKMFALNMTTVELEEKASALSAIAVAGANGGLNSATKVAGFTAGEVKRTLTFVMTIIGLAMVLGAFVAFVITRMITRPLKTVVGLLERVGSGDLTFGREAFSYDGSDELGQMADAMAAMISVLREAIGEIITEARQTAVSAESLAALSEEANASVGEIKSAVEQVASMSESNSAALQETNAGVQEVSTSAGNSAQASTQGAAFASHVIEVAEETTREVDGVIQDIRGVGKQSEEIVHAIDDLSGAVEAISDFVDTITGIADQTNLLALNAAIEAARAGDAGRGFAVVADEVRKLAEESGRAASEVGTLISRLQDDTSRAMGATNETGETMKKTVANAKKAQDKLAESLSDVAKINDTMQNIAAGAQEQAAAAEQMATGVDQVSAATAQVVEAVENIKVSSGETAKVSEGVAAQAQELMAGAERIQQSLARFRVEMAEAADAEDAEEETGTTVPRQTEALSGPELEPTA